MTESPKSRTDTDTDFDPYDYPLHWEADVLASDGGTLHLRPITPADAEQVRALHGRLSSRTRYFRYFGPYPRISEADLRRFTTMDHHDRVAFAAWLGDDIVAIGRYERLEATGSAEVAFVVDDANQSRGLGSILLEHLAAAARERGLSRFVADVLSENRRMVRVFRDAGYEVSRELEEGVIRLEFDIDPTERSVAVARDREQAAEARSVRNVLHPRSIAVIGASNDPSKVGHAVFANLLASRFTGPVYPVNSDHLAVGGVRAYRDVTDIPDPVDLAVIAVPASGVEEVADACLAKNVKALVVASSGFSEAGPSGHMAEQRLAGVARAHGMRVVGPNALGVVNTEPGIGLNATLAPRLPPPGRAGFFCQSGALGITILAGAASRGLGLSTFVSAGNRADVSGNDLLQYWETDPGTDLVLLYLESFGNPRKFARLARRLARHKPVVAVKSGRHAPSPALEHTAVPLDESSVAAVFEQAGVIRVETIDQLFDTALLLANQPLTTGENVAVVGNSTAIGVLAADTVIDRGLQLGCAPVDTGAQASPEELGAAVRAALGDPGVDALVVVFVPPIAVPVADYAAALRNAAAQEDGGKPIVSTFLAVEGVPSELAAPGGDGGAEHGSIPSYPSPERAVQALARVQRYATWRAAPLGDTRRPSDMDPPGARELVDALLAAAEQRDLSGPEITRLLAAYGIRVEPVEHADSADGAAGVSCSVGVREDPSFGSLVSFGLAGPIAELVGDHAYRAVPLTNTDAHGLVRAPASAALLAGGHGSPTADLDALAELVLRVSALADDLPELRSLRLEPVMVEPRGVVVVAARGMLVRSGGRPDEGPRRLRS
jgi:acyl-CoA synthetase (NDP forming)/RimJ/RimL family protein N-acetyltransferase